MPLPQFLLLIVSVLIAAGTTIWVAVKAGISLTALGLLALTGVGIVHLSMRDSSQ